MDIIMRKKNINRSTNNENYIIIEIDIVVMIIKTDFWDCRITYNIKCVDIIDFNHNLKDNEELI